jgi:hypothetical protein
VTNAFTIPKQAFTQKERHYFNQSVFKSPGGQKRAKALGGVAVHGLATPSQRRPK